MGVTVEHLAQRIADNVGGLKSPSQRCLVAIAGPPASGKSTLAAATQTRLNEMGHKTGLVPMDGFHLDNQVLLARGLRHRKGAPETFDVTGFVHLVRRLRSEAEVFAPAFDRTRDLTINAQIEVTADMPIVLLEGNYLLFDAPGWRDLAPLWDLSIRLDVPLDTLHDRLWDRWSGLGLDPATITQKVDENDLANARLVAARAIPADVTLGPD